MWDPLIDAVSRAPCCDQCILMVSESLPCYLATYAMQSLMETQVDWKAMSLKYGAIDDDRTIMQCLCAERYSL